MLRLEIVGMLAADAIRKGHLDLCEKYSGNKNKFIHLKHDHCS
jgi:hypothetical protein